NNYLPGIVDHVNLGINPQNFAMYQNDPRRIDESVAVRAIPWFFIDPNRPDPQVVFDTLLSKKTLLIDGTTKVQKDGVEVSFELNDPDRSEEHTSELQSRENLVCRLLLEKKKATRTSE